MRHFFTSDLDAPNLRWPSAAATVAEAVSKALYRVCI